MKRCYNEKYISPSKIRYYTDPKLLHVNRPIPVEFRSNLVEFGPNHEAIF